MDYSNSGSIKFGMFNCEATVVKHNCNYCVFMTDLRVILNDHIQTHRSFQNNQRTDFVINKYLCRNCNFESHSLLVYHQHHETCIYVSARKNKGSEGLNNFTQCDNKECNLKRRMKTKKRMVGSNQCSCKTTSIWDLKKHIIARYKAKIKQHVESYSSLKDAFYESTQCSSETTEEPNLKLDVNTHPPSSKQGQWFKCGQCDYMTEKKLCLKNHTKFVHLRESLVYHECKHCSHKTLYESHLRKHIITHHPDSNETELLECELCEYKTRHNWALRRHMRNRHDSNTEIQHECGQCSYKTSSKASLANHVIADHTNAKEIRLFKCDQCEFIGRSKISLQRHFNLKHAPENLIQYKCSLCVFETVYEQSLKYHMNVRHAIPNEVKLFDCHQCGFVGTKCGLRRHIKLKHPM